MWRRSAAPTTQSDDDGAVTGNARSATGTEKLNYNTVKDAVKNEKQLMKLLIALGEEDFVKLMHSTEEYVKAMQQQQQAQLEMAELAARKAQSDAMGKMEEEKTKREQQYNESRLRAMQIKAQQQKELEKIKTEEAKKRIEYELMRQTEEEEKRERIRLEAKKEFNRLDSENIREREEQERRQFEREKDLLKYKMEESARLKRENERELAGLRLEQELKKHEATKADALKRDTELKKIEADADVKKEEIKWERISNFFSGEEGRQRMMNVGGLVVGSLAALYFFKTVQPVAERGLKNYFFKPTLVSRSITYTPLERFGFSSLRGLFKPVPPRPDVILEPKLQQRLDAVIEGTRNTASRGGLYGHMMLWGKPGTGKTLFAEKLAHESKMDFAVMSGPAFDQFTPEEAIVEIKTLFKWANRSRHGLLLFVDEADSFLEDRSTLRHDRVPVLNEWLNQTGTESRKFMCVYETNRPFVLDPAVQSRVTRSIEITPPSSAEIQRMLEQYLRLYVLGDVNPGHYNKRRVFPLSLFGKPRGHVEKKELSELRLELPEVAQNLAKEGFVGRDVSNLAIAVAQSLYAEKNFELTKEMFDSIVSLQLDKKRKENEYMATRQERIDAVRKFNKHL